jgi:hypothetical protein
MTLPQPIEHDIAESLVRRINFVGQLNPPASLSSTKKFAGQTVRTFSSLATEIGFFSDSKRMDMPIYLITFAAVTMLPQQLIQAPDRADMLQGVVGNSSGVTIAMAFLKMPGAA